MAIKITSPLPLIIKKYSYLIALDKKLTLLTLPPSPTAPSGQDERVYDQTGLSAAHPHPARPCNPQAAVLDPQDRSIPSAALTAQMPQGIDTVRTQ